MATETVPVGAGPATAPRTLTLDEERRYLGLESAWELDALRNALNDLCQNLGDPDTPQDQLMALRLKVRGLTMRMGQLASVVMSVLDDELNTAELSMKVHGYASTAEMDHG